MRITARRWGPILGVGLLLLAAYDVPAGRAAEDPRDTPWLGVYSQALTPELREGLDYSGQGVLINRVVPGSPADRAGLQKGDLLVRVGSRVVDSPEALLRVVRAARVGQNVALQIVRAGKSQTLSAKLEGRSADENIEAPEPPDMDRDRVEPAPMEGEDQDIGIPFPDEGLAMLQTMGRGRLGVRIESLDPDLGEYFGVKDGKGALVLEVVKDTPAERAGMKTGDVILRVGDHAVSGSEDLIDAIRSSEGEVSLTVVRHGTKRVVEARLEKAPRELRMRRGNGPMDWSGDGKRVRMRIFDAPGGDRDELRRELLDLRKELRDLRREIEGLKRD
jgi:C-terminal processing protease CtpA/Prc